MKRLKRSPRESGSFDLTTAARALAASTVAYLEPHARGLTFASYMKVAKKTLVPPLSKLMTPDHLGRDISKGMERAVSGTDVVEKALAVIAAAQGQKEVLSENFNGDYEYYEHYDREGKQRVRAMAVVTHAKASRRKEGAIEKRLDSAKDLEFSPGSILLIFRGTDNLNNVIADIKAVTSGVGEPYVSTGFPRAKSEASKSERPSKATVHFGFRDAWYGDGLRNTLLQYTIDKLAELGRECDMAKKLGIQMVQSSDRIDKPTVDITGHSLGASIGVLAAFDLARSLRLMDREHRVHIRVYTVGCPRTGNVAFVKAYNDLVPDTWNVINDNDIVPAIPHSSSWIRSCLPAFFPCRETGYRRHGRSVILKSDGRLIVDPTRRQKYRREAKVLRVPKAIECHETRLYRAHIRAAIRKEIEKLEGRQSHNKSTGMSEELRRNVKRWEELDCMLEGLGGVIREALSDPQRSFRILPGGT